MDERSQKVLQSNPSALNWIIALELGYEAPRSTSSPLSVCFCCQKEQTETTNLSRCSKCRVATYCNRDCQVRDWKAQHKNCCESLRRAGPFMNFTLSAEGRNDNDTAQEMKQEARRDVFQRIRFYACAYAVHQASTLGKGFLFVQSDQTLASLSLTLPIDAKTGRTMTQSRAVLLHYLTLGEYDAEVCRDDFEMATIRTELQRAVDDCDEQSHLVLLMRFRCGHVALGTAALVPDYQVCRKLGVDYFGESAPPSLQLNIDDI